MRGPSLTRTAMVLTASVVLVASAGCGARPTDGDSPATDAISAGSDLTEAPVATPGHSPSPDPFAGIESLRPLPWTGWPVENLEIAREAGWRIDPVTGGFVLEQGLSFVTDAGAFVLAIAPGEVIETIPLESASASAANLDSDLEPEIELVIAHGDGIESRYSPISDALVHTGLPVTRGAAIGLAAGRTLTLLITVDGVPIDPLLVLRQPLHRWR